MRFSPEDPSVTASEGNHYRSYSLSNVSNNACRGSEQAPQGVRKLSLVEWTGANFLTRPLLSFCPVQQFQP